MKSFKTYLNEQEIPKEMMEVLEGIKKNSKPFLKMINNDVTTFNIFSGRTIENTFIRTIRKNRRPRDSGIELQMIIDDIFKKKFGERFRQNSLFVFSNIFNTNDFGSPHLIFPIGNFKFLWSPEIQDLTTNLPDPLQKKLDKKEIQKFINSHNYTTKNLKNAIKSRNEILISGNEYYAISKDIIRKWRFPIEHFLKELKNIL